jgi:heat shock protein HslJ
MAGGLAVAGGLLLACSAPSRPADARAGFVNRVWKVSQSSSVAPGTLYAFLSEGTMVIASEHGTPSFGKWRQKEGTLTLVEEGLPYRTEILRQSRDTFRIRMHNPGEPVEITFVPAEGDQAVMPKEAGGDMKPRAQAGGLLGTAWQLEDLGGAGVIDKSMTTLEFIEAGRVAGRGGCNRFFGSVEITGESIKFGQMGSTRMACVEALMNQEGRYLKALGDANRYSLNGDELLVYAKGLDKPLRFTRKTQ